MRRRRINFYVKHRPNTSSKEARSERNLTEAYLSMKGIRSVGFDGFTPDSFLDWNQQQALSAGKTLEEACDFTVSYYPEIPAQFCMEKEEDYNACVQLCKELLQGE